MSNSTPTETPFNEDAERAALAPGDFKGLRTFNKRKAAADAGQLARVTEDADEPQVESQVETTEAPTEAQPQADEDAERAAAIARALDAASMKTDAEIEADVRQLANRAQITPEPAQADEDEPQVETEPESQQDEPEAPEEAPAAPGKATGEQVYLVAALATAARFIYKRATLPVLRAVKVEARGDFVTITATDLDTTAQITLPAFVEAPLCAITDAERAKDLCAMLPNAPITLTAEADGSAVTFRSGASVYNLRAENCGSANDFPAIPQANPTTTATANAREFGKALASVLPFIMRGTYAGDLRGGVQISTDGATITAHARDEHRARSASAPLQMEMATTSQPEAPEACAVLPGATARELQRICTQANPQEWVRVSFGADFMQVECGYITITARKLGERMKGAGLEFCPLSTITARAEDLQKALKALAPVAGSVDVFSTDNEAAIFYAHEAGTGEAMNEVPATITHADNRSQTPRVRLNVKYLLDALKGKKKGEPVVLEIGELRRDTPHPASEQTLCARLAGALIMPMDKTHAQNNGSEPSKAAEAPQATPEATPEPAQVESQVESHEAPAEPEAAPPAQADESQVETEPETHTYYTDAPRAYDGFGTRQTGTGEDDRGRKMRRVEIHAPHLTWQLARYSSGLKAGFTPAQLAEFGGQDTTQDAYPTALELADEAQALAIKLAAAADEAKRAGNDRQARRYLRAMALANLRTYRRMDEIDAPKERAEARKYRADHPKTHKAPTEPQPTPPAGPPAQVESQVETPEAPTEENTEAMHSETAPQPDSNPAEQQHSNTAGHHAPGDGWKADSEGIVFAHAADVCAALGLDAAELWREAYEEHDGPDFEAFEVYPEDRAGQARRATAADLAAVLNDLEAINAHRFYATLQSAAELQQGARDLAERLQDGIPSEPSQDTIPPEPSQDAIPSEASPTDEAPEQGEPEQEDEQAPEDEADEDEGDEDEEEPDDDRPDLDARRAAFHAKKQRRIDRLNDAAEAAKRRSDAAYQASRRATEGIPFGQPILVGHHSEGRHRAALKRSDQGMRRCIEEGDKAKEYAYRAAAAEQNDAIQSDDPDAPELLREKIEKLEKEQATMKAANVAIRKGDDAALAALGFSEKSIATLKTPDFCNRIGFPDYKLTNNGANIRRLKQRLELLEKRAQDKTSEQVLCGVTITDNADENRLQLEFPERPDLATYKELKSHGFRKTREGIWQRHRSTSASFWGKEIAKHYGERNPQHATPEPAPDADEAPVEAQGTIPPEASPEDEAPEAPAQAPEPQPEPQEPIQPEPSPQVEAPEPAPAPPAAAVGAIDWKAMRAAAKTRGNLADVAASVAD